MNKVDFINKVKDYLLEHGWCQGTYISEGRVCLEGAMNRCEGAWNEAAFDVRMDLSNMIGTSITAWNDNKERTFNDVMDVLDELAKNTKEEK